MGEARQKRLDAGQPMTFDVNAIQLTIGTVDAATFARNPDGTEHPDRVQGRALKFLLSALMQDAFPQGMDRPNGQIWLAWQEGLEDGTTPLEMTKGDVEWLKERVLKDTVKVPHMLVQWREALCAYLKGLGAPENG